MIRKALHSVVTWALRYSLAKGDPELIRLFGGGAIGSAGVEVNEKSALSVSAIFGCVRNISEDIGKLPLITYRQLRPMGKERLHQHPAYPLLHDRPNAEMTAMTFRAAITASALLFGKGVAEIEWKRNGQPAAIWPIEPWRVTLRRDNQKTLYFEVDGKRRLDLADALYVPGFSIDGVVGEMIARLGEDSIGVAMAAQRFAAAFFGNGAAMGVVITHPATLSDKAKDNIRSGWEKAHKGPNNAHKTTILDEGIKVEKTTYANNEAQMLETRQFAVEDVARWFRCPPHKIGHLLRAAGWSTLEATNADYVIDTLMPWAVKWEQEIKWKILVERDVFAEHLFDALLRGDTLARAQANQIRFMNGALTIDEWRAMENLNPLENGLGGRHFVPVNLAPIEKAVRDADQPASDPASEFKRDVVKSFLADKTVNDVIYNVTNIPELLTDVGLPLEENVKQDPDQAIPYLPVTAENGPLVSGAVITDREGDIVGGDIENELPADASGRNGAPVMKGSGVVAAGDSGADGEGENGEESNAEPGEAGK